MMNSDVIDSSVIRFSDLQYLVETYMINVNVLNNINEMQSETAYFAYGATTRRSRRNIRVVFDSGSFAPCVL